MALPDREFARSQPTNRKFSSTMQAVDLTFNPITTPITRAARLVKVAHVIGQDVFAAHLQDTGTRLVCQGQKRAKVQVVREHHIPI